jgi:hypothetical protein
VKNPEGDGGVIRKQKMETPTKMMTFLSYAAFAMTSGIDIWERRYV